MKRNTVKQIVRQTVKRKIPKCKVPKCPTEARFWVPSDWCKKHWNQWWFWPLGKKEPAWMKPSQKLRRGA